MNALIFDFVRRWRWGIGFYALLTAFVAMAGMPVAFTPVAMVCLIFDGQRGAFRSIRPLPVARRAQALAWWIIGVPLPSLLAIAPAALGTLLLPHFGRPTAEPWFFFIVNTIAGLGWGSLCFLMATALPTRPPVGVLETLGQAVIGMLWGVLFPSSILVMQFLPKTAAAIRPWHLLLASAVPIFVILSFLTATELLRRRTSVSADTAPRSRKRELPSSGHGINGAGYYLLTFGGRMLLMLFAMAAVQLATISFFVGRAAGSNPVLMIQLVMMALIFAVVTTDMVGMRALRTLPLSTFRLAALILSVPAMAGLGSGLIAILFQSQNDSSVLPVVRLFSTALLVAGLGSLLIAIVLHIAGGVRLVVMILVGMLSAVFVPLGAPHPWILAATGAVAGSAGFALLLRGLRRSPKFYQPRPFLGTAFGPASCST